MIVVRTYRHRLSLTLVQEDMARQFAGCVRLIYNAGLEQRRLGYALTKRSTNYAQQCADLTELKRDADFSFLNDVPSQILQQALRDVQQAYENFFNGTRGYPRHFRRKGENESFRFPQAKWLRYNDPGRPNGLRLPKLGWVKVRNSYPHLRDQGLICEGTLKNATVRQKNGQWYISLVCEVDIPDPPQRTAERIVGLDLGVVVSVADSGGNLHQLPAPNAQDLAHIEELHRRLSRTRPGSQNRRKARERLRRAHARQRRRLHAAMHNLSLQLVRDYDIIAIEDLRIDNMTRSPRGTKAQPGRGVRTAAGKNRAILNQGWGEFLRQLKYKAPWYGATVIAVPPHYSSQECAACHWVSRENRKSQAEFRCTRCGHTAHADTNAACVIRTRGIALLHKQQAGRAAGTAASGEGSPKACVCESASKYPERIRPSRKSDGREALAGDPTSLTVSLTLTREVHHGGALRQKGAKAPDKAQGRN